MGAAESNPVKNMDKRTSRREYKEHFVRGILEYKRALEPQKDSNVEISDQSLRLKVYIRKRPIFPYELNDGEFDVITCCSANEIIVHDGRMHIDMRRLFINHSRFLFDRVFDEKTQNEEVFQVAASSLIQNAAEGGYATCLVYGQTGSGKTFTMSYIYQQMASELFTRVYGDSEVRSSSTTVSVSFFEVAGDIVSDLLNGYAQVQLMTAKDDAVHPIPVVEAVVSSPEELLAMVNHGCSVRSTASTGVNDTSSRSHAILRIYITPEQAMTAPLERNPGDPTYEGVLTLVDLAGSEFNIDSAYHSGERRKEGAAINASLAALKECLRARALGKLSGFLYRSSKLTLALKLSFTLPEAMTTIIACVSPASKDTEHSVSTLRHACIMDGQSTGSEKETRFLTGGKVEKQEIGDLNISKIARERAAKGTAGEIKNNNGNFFAGHSEPELTDKQKEKARRIAEQRAIKKLTPQFRALLMDARDRLRAEPKQLRRMHRIFIGGGGRIGYGNNGGGEGGGVSRPASWLYGGVGVRGGDDDGDGGGEGGRDRCSPVVSEQRSLSRMAVNKRTQPTTVPSTQREGRDGGKPEPRRNDNAKSSSSPSMSQNEGSVAAGGGGGLNVGSNPRVVHSPVNQGTATRSQLRVSVDDTKWSRLGELMKTSGFDEEQTAEAIKYAKLSDLMRKNGYSEDEIAACRSASRTGLHDIPDEITDAAGMNVEVGQNYEDSTPVKSTNKTAKNQIQGSKSARFQSGDNSPILDSASRSSSRKHSMTKPSATRSGSAARGNKLNQGPSENKGKAVASKTNNTRTGNGKPRSKWSPDPTVESPRKVGPEDELERIQNDLLAEGLTEAARVGLKKRLANLQAAKIREQRQEEMRVREQKRLDEKLLQEKMKNIRADDCDGDGVGDPFVRRPALQRRLASSSAPTASQGDDGGEEDDYRVQPTRLRQQPNSMRSQSGHLGDRGAPGPTHGQARVPRRNPDYDDDGGYGQVGYRGQSPNQRRRGPSSGVDQKNGDEEVSGYRYGDAGIIRERGPYQQTNYDEDGEDMNAGNGRYGGEDREYISQERESQASKLSLIRGRVASMARKPTRRPSVNRSRADPDDNAYRDTGGDTDRNGDDYSNHDQNPGPVMQYEGARSASRGGRRRDAVGRDGSSGASNAPWANDYNWAEPR